MSYKWQDRCWCLHHDIQVVRCVDCGIDMMVWSRDYDFSHPRLPTNRNQLTNGCIMGLHGLAISKCYTMRMKMRKRERRVLHRWWRWWWCWSKKTPVHNLMWVGVEHSEALCVRDRQHSYLLPYSLNPAGKTKLFIIYPGLVRTNISTWVQPCVEYSRSTVSENWWLLNEHRRFITDD